MRNMPNQLPKEQEEHKQFEKEKAAVKKWLERKLKTLKRRKENYIEDLQKCLNWEKVQYETELLQANLFKLKKGDKSVIVHDWNEDKEKTITLDPNLSSKEELTIRFKKVKKLKRGIEPIKRMIDKYEKEIANLSALIETLPAIANMTLLEELKNHLRFPDITKEPKEKAKIPDPFFTFRTEAKMIVLVGKNAKGNEKLTFQRAKGNDWWFHVRDYSGSHVVLQVDKAQDPDEESILDAAHLALYYSKAKNHHEGEVSVTQCKYVRRLGSKTGQVQISKHKNIYIKADPKRIERLKKVVQ